MSLSLGASSGTTAPQRSAVKHRVSHTLFFYTNADDCIHLFLMGAQQ